MIDHIDYRTRLSLCLLLSTCCVEPSGPTTSYQRQAADAESLRMRCKPTEKIHIYSPMYMCIIMRIYYSDKNKKYIYIFFFFFLVFSHYIEYIFMYIVIVIMKTAGKRQRKHRP